MSIRHKEGPAARQRGTGPKQASSSQRKANGKPKASQPHQEAPYANKRRLAVYDGRRLLGHVAGCESRWEACSPSGEPIGIYVSWIDAANAVTCAEVAS